jgi:divalent metal cation (Fe/Co/Zn/Cd) transporter
MTAATSSSIPDVTRRVLQLQILTVVCMSVEAAISLSAAWRSHSAALFAFGGDSLVELLSATVVFWRFRLTLNEKRAARLAGVLLAILAAFVALTSALNLFGYRETQRSPLGITILAAAAVAMPWLAREKRKLAAVTRIARSSAENSTEKRAIVRCRANLRRSLSPLRGSRKLRVSMAQSERRCLAELSASARWQQ